MSKKLRAGCGGGIIECAGDGNHADTGVGRSTGNDLSDDIDTG